MGVSSPGSIEAQYVALSSRRGNPSSSWSRDDPGSKSRRIDEIPGQGAHFSFASPTLATFVGR